MHGSIDRRETYSADDLELIEQLAAAEARESFWAYRQYMRPKLVIGWFQRELAMELQRFYEDWRAGRAPILALHTPPQHGKSWTLIDFISWCQGHDPDSKAIYSSFSDRLGVRANLWLQRYYDSPKFRKVFPDLVISQSNVVTMSGRYLRNHEVIEYVGRDGSFRNTTVNGSINGEGLDLGFIDDPIKGRKEANSRTVRDATWDWFTDDFFGRFSQRAGFIVIATRWHVDDPSGRMIEHFGKQMRVLRYSALAEQNEDHRRKDEPLFPELKDKAFLLKRKNVLSQSGWESQYQQSPIVVGGGTFPVDKFEIVQTRPAPKHICKTVRYWDKAGTQGGGAYTAGVRIDELSDGTFLVSDVRHGQWSALERETRIKQAAISDNADGYHCEIWVEQEPGSGGKESAENTVRQLRMFSVYADRVSGQGSKETRVEPYAAQVQAGNVNLLAAEWNQGFIDEHETWPTGTYKDRVDAAGGAYNKVVGGGSRYTLDNL